MSDLRTDRGTRPVPAAPESGSGGPRRMITASIALGAVAAFGIGIWFAYDQGVKRGSSGAPPLVRADQNPTKVAPENPGGMQVPNQDKEIYSRMTPANGAAQPQTERLLPPPERPNAERPAASPPAVTVPNRPVNTVPNQTTAPSPTPTAPTAQTAQRPAGAPPGPRTGPLANQSAASATPSPAPATTPTPQPATPPRSAAAPATAPAATPAPVPATGGNARVQLASLKDQAAAQATWTQIQRKHADVLAGLSPSFERVDLGDKGVYFRLQAGPLKDRAAAQAVCQKLSAAGQGCIVVGR